MFLIVALVLCLLAYISRNNVETYNQNIETITNIAAAEAGRMHIALGYSAAELRAAYNYCDGKPVPELLDYLATVIDADGEYQLLKYDPVESTELYHVYRGYSTKRSDGEYRPVVYENTSLSTSVFANSKKEGGAVSFSQNFTNATDALRYFAVFCGVTALEDGQAQTYYLVKPQKEGRLLEQLQTYSQYAQMARAICYTDGKYLAFDSDFRADNFYDYLYKYNDLSMDQRNAIRDQVQGDEDGIGTLTYKDYRGRDCVFAYAACADTDNWLVLVSVPTSEFVAGQLVSFFPLIIIVFLGFLLVFNIWRLLIVVRELRLSVERERVANMSKTSFLSRMSHEIRTPLNAIIGYNSIAHTEMTEAKTESQRRRAESNVVDCLSKSETASKHLLAIINDVLDMSAIESGKIKIAHDRFDFKSLINSLTTIFYSQAMTRSIDFNVVFDSPTEEWLVGDQMRTSQILTNLLSNALKFTPEGGAVTLTVEQTRTDDKTARMHFTVADTGIGMAPEYLSRVWAPFEQADSSISRRFGGTGLGLSITKTLVDLMGGTIAVESSPGHGSRFDVELSFERAEPSPGDKVYDFSAVNALVVDDDPNTCDYVLSLFGRCGAKCSAVCSGAAALEAVSAAKRRGESFTLYMVDWQMPEMDGLETIRRIKALDGDKAPIIVLTAYDYSAIAGKAQDLGVTRFISKPLFQSSLFDLLSSVSGISRRSVPQRRSRDYDFSGDRVLLAEDNEMNMEIAKRILRSAGLTVDSAWNGRQAVDMFESAPAGTYGAILMDVHMPEMDGHEASRTIRASSHPEAKTIPIIAMTADVFAEDVAEARASGMNDHIGKPIDVTLLFDTLKRYLEKDDAYKQ